MPGYKWTVHRYKGVTAPQNLYMKATGAISKGKNRISTIDATYGPGGYRVKSMGFGKNAGWLSERSGVTLAMAFRDLQDHYEDMARMYQRHASDLQNGRAKKEVK